MESNWDVEVDIPDDLNNVILQGLQEGKAVVARRRCAVQAATRTICSVVLAAVFLVGGIRLSPAFAAAVGELPVLGELVQVFGKNQPIAQGGTRQGEGMIALAMERDGDTERIRLDFPSADASLYRAEFASFPKTVTITLPGTEGINVLSQISRAQDTSQYIKSVCQLPLGSGGSTVIQLELESDADVQIQEYREPGSLVICLTPADIRLDTVYSLRTLSYTGEELAAAANRYLGEYTRILRDEAGEFFLEFAQYATLGEAEEQRQAMGGQVLVEQRTGNNVPVSFQSMEDYESSRFLDKYYELLLHADSVEQVMDFMEQHFEQATPQERDVMLRGLDGMLHNHEDDEEEVNWEKVASFYQIAGETLPDYVQQNVR